MRVPHLMAASQLAELRAHLYRFVRPRDLLHHLAMSDEILWDWYEAEYAAAYGTTSPARDLVERFRRRDPLRARFSTSVELLAAEADRRQA
jgi:hypothetical protein